MVIRKKALIITLMALIGQTAFVQPANLRPIEAAKVLKTTVENLKPLVNRGGWVNMTAAKLRFTPIEPAKSIVLKKPTALMTIVPAPKPSYFTSLIDTAKANPVESFSGLFAALGFGGSYLIYKQQEKAKARAEEARRLEESKNSWFSSWFGKASK